MEPQHVRRQKEIRLEVLRMAQQIANSQYELKASQIVHDGHVNNKAYKLPTDNRVQEILNLAEEYLEFIQVEVG
tara:strand:- start:637 stop:858 length:222 start_codon:yes stop_codon:yes gene_type:complete